MPWDEGGWTREFVIDRRTLSTPERMLSPEETRTFERLAEMVRRWRERDG
jgi:hypothetical protein